MSNHRESTLNLSSESCDGKNLLPLAAPFSSLIRGAIEQPEHGASVLADPHHICNYRNIAGYLEAIQGYLISQQIRPGDGTITVELNNSVRAALTALALLDAGYSFMALPVRGQGSRGGGHEIPSAQFSRWIVSVSTDKAAAQADLAAPADYLVIHRNADFDPAAVDPSTGAPRLFFRTSGSLGSPKLAVHSHERFRGNVLNARQQMGLKTSYRIALPTPIFHLYGLGVGFLASFSAGASIDFQERGNLLRFLEREEDFDPNVAFVTPAFCESLLRGRKKRRAYELMITSGDRISEATFRRSEDMHGPVINSYGCTEMGSVSTGHLGMTSELRCQSVGHPYPGVQHRIVHGVASQAHDDSMGELQLKYQYGFEGYVDLSGKSLIPPNAFDDGWYRTGDLAAAGEDGTIQVLGRCDLSVNRGGVLLPFADVENRLRELDGIEEAAVAAGPEGINGRTLVAFCVTKQGADVSEREYRFRYAESAPAFSVPDVIRIVAAIPKLSNGKIDRRALATQAQQPVL